MKHLGGCVCGKVRYRLASAPMFVHCCHCRKCQRLSGSAFAVNAPIETDRVELLASQPHASMRPGEDRLRHTDLHCETCGTALWSHHPAFGTRIALVSVGTLDDPGVFPPEIHCFTRSKLPWVVLPEGVRVAEGNYDPDEVWPAESLARLRASLA